MHQRASAHMQCIGSDDANITNCSAITQVHPIPPSPALASPRQPSPALASPRQPSNLTPSNHSQVALTSPLEKFALKFARSLLKCDLVVASALHGLIVSDALRVPSIWV